MLHSKKGQTGGLITGLVFGVASLVIGVIIAFVIVSTLTDANLIGDDTTSTLTTSLETGGWINKTAYQLGTSNASLGSYTISGAQNTTSGQTILVGNYTLDTSAGTVTNATTTTYEAVTFNYTTVFSYDNVYKESSDKMSGNFTEGVDNVSDKIPTVLLVAAIVLILGILVLLVATWQRMRMGGGGL